MAFFLYSLRCQLQREMSLRKPFQTVSLEVVGESFDYLAIKLVNLFIIYLTTSQERAAYVRATKIDHATKKN